MRLTEKERGVIAKSVREFDCDAKVYLYGSRIDSTLKGGDIDLLVVSEKISFANKIDILVQVKSVLGEQKIDLTIRNKEELRTDPFFREVKKTEIY